MDLNNIQELADALVKFQADVPDIPKTKAGVHGSKYAPLDEVQKVIKPILKANALAVSQPLSEIDGQPAIVTILMHTSGQCIQSTTPLILAKQDPQSHGSSITYARRYALASILGLTIDEDDDADSSTQQVQSSGPHKASDNKPASDKQKAYLAVLYKQHAEKNEDQRTLVQWMEDEHGIVDAASCTSADVSLLIEELK